MFIYPDWDPNEFLPVLIYFFLCFSHYCQKFVSISYACKLTKFPVRGQTQTVPVILFSFILVDLWMDGSVFICHTVKGRSKSHSVSESFTYLPVFILSTPLIWWMDPVYFYSTQRRSHQTWHHFQFTPCQHGDTVWHVSAVSSSMLRCAWEHHTHTLLRWVINSSPPSPFPVGVLPGSEMVYFTTIIINSM